MSVGYLPDTEWEKFYKWCKKLWPMWAPDRMSIKLYLEWKEDSNASN